MKMGMVVELLEVLLSGKQNEQGVWESKSVHLQDLIVR